MRYGLAIGLDVSGPEDNSPPLKLKTILRTLDPEIAEKAKEISPRKALLSISNYRDLENYYRRGIELFPKISSQFPDHVVRRIVTVCACDDVSGVDGEAVAQ